MNRTKKGFTLVELLVVIAIIGIISAVAVPVVISQIDKAKVATVENEATTTVDAVQEAVAIIVSDSGAYPEGATKANILAQLNKMYTGVKNVHRLVVNKVNDISCKVTVYGREDVKKNGQAIVKEQSYALPIEGTIGDDIVLFVNDSGSWVGEDPNPPAPTPDPPTPAPGN